MIDRIGRVERLQAVNVAFIEATDPFFDQLFRRHGLPLVAS
jgi:hypothetical protein